LDPGGAAALVTRTLSHRFQPVHDFWDEVAITRLVTDDVVALLSAALRDWLLARAEEIAREAEGWVGFSMAVTNVPATLLLARRLRELNPDLLLVVGGPHVTARSAAAILRSCPFLD